MSESEYVVDVKPTARRANGAVGVYVRDHGTRRAFDDREAAEAWARAVSDGGGSVWVRDANPDDSADVDGYLMAYAREADRDDGGLPGEQEGLELFGVELVADPHDSEQVPLERFDLD